MTVELEPKPRRLVQPAVAGNEAALQMLTDALMEMRDRAQESLPDFFEFAIRADKTRLPLKICQHQRLIFQFIAEHPCCVIRTPVNTHKTYSVASWILWQIGRDRTKTGAIASKTEDMSKQTLKVIGEWITDPILNPPVRLVFPALVRGAEGKQWHSTALEVDRPAGIADPTLRALGTSSGKSGRRFDFSVCDDLVDYENSMTLEKRDGAEQFFTDHIWNRRDQRRERCIVINTPWHSDDLTFRLEHGWSWPTMTMNVYGEVKFSNVAEGFAPALLIPHPSAADKFLLRELAGKAKEDWTICGFQYPPDVVERTRLISSPHDWARSYMCEPFHEGAARCKPEWIKAGQKLGKGLRFVDSYEGPNPTYTGVDLSVGKNTSSDESVIFTAELLPDGRRRVLCIDSGRWDVTEIVKRIISHANRYHSVVHVESNSGQDFVRQLVALSMGRAARQLRVSAHDTNRSNKHNVDFGVESMFNEIANGLWIFPSDELGRSHPELEGRGKLFDQCVQYQPPPAHTGDHLMAMWICRERMRRGGGGRDPRPNAGRGRRRDSGGGF